MSMSGQPLRLAMFLMPVHDANKPMAQCFDEDLELVEICERLGFSDFWVGEHHSSTVENIVMPKFLSVKHWASRSRFDWVQRPFAFSIITRPTSPAGWRSLITYRMAG